MSETNELRSYIRHLIQQEMLIINDEESDYQKFFNSVLKKFGVTSPDQLSDAKKKAFFDYIDSNYKAKDECCNGEEDLEETSSVGGMGGGDGYQTPNAFSKSGKHSKRALDKSKFKKVKDITEASRPNINIIKKKGGEFYADLDTDSNLWTVFDTEFGDYGWGSFSGKNQAEKKADDMNKSNKLGKYSVNESVDFRNNEITPGRRMNQAVSTMRKSLREINKVLSKSAKFKQEAGVTTDKYWLRTRSSLRKLSEELITVMNRLNSIK